MPTKFLKNMRKIVCLLILVLFTSAFKQRKLPNVLIIGDSISIGYTPFVKSALRGKANVFHNQGNAQHTGNGLEKLDDWLGDTKWDVIHFNWGLWDLCYRNPEVINQGNRDKKEGTVTFTPEQYGSNLEKLVLRLKNTGAKLIFATTTYVPEGEVGRFENANIEYNKVALKIMKKYGVTVNYMSKISKEVYHKYAKGTGDVHYNMEGYSLLSIPVTEIIERKIQFSKHLSR
jgi:hypothetical protein